MIYRIHISSHMVYVVDTRRRIFWPEKFPDTTSPLFPAMDPETPAFKCTVIEKLPEGTL